MRFQIFFLGYLITFSSPSDPCGNHTVLENSWRSTNCRDTDCTGQWMCDKQLAEGWYRFKSSAGWKIPEQAVSGRHCSADIPIWLNGSHPTVGQGEATRAVCFTQGGSCSYTLDIKIKNCSDYFVYELKPPPHCYAAYCTDPSTAREQESRETSLPTSTESSSQIPVESLTPDPSTAPGQESRETSLPTSTESSSQITTESLTPDPSTAPGQESRETSLPTSTESSSQIPVESLTPDPSRAPGQESRETSLPTSTESSSQIPTESLIPGMGYQIINVEVTSVKELDDETAKRVVLHKVKQMFKDQCPKEPIDWDRVEVQCSDMDESDP